MNSDHYASEADKHKKEAEYWREQMNKLRLETDREFEAMQIKVDNAEEFARDMQEKFEAKKAEEEAEAEKQRAQQMADNISRAADDQAA